MTNDHTLPTTAPGRDVVDDAPPAFGCAVADDATTADGRAPDQAEHVAGIAPRDVVCLTMYLREGLYLVDLASGGRRQVERDDWHRLVHEVVSRPDSRLSPVTAGRYDVIWRVEWTTREEE